MTVQFGFSLQGRGVLAGREAITTLAKRADALGYDSIWITDRLLIPVHTRTAYPYSSTGAFPLGPDEPWLEALTALTYLATITERIRVGTSVLVVPYRNPVHTAKALATADYLSGGRVIFGAGIGWWREEFESLGVPFADRAARTLEYLRIMKAIWTGETAEFHGRFVSFDPIWSYPKPVQKPHPPVLLGGESEHTLRRVVEFCDGWFPRGRNAADAGPVLAGLDRLGVLARQAGRDPKTISTSVFGARPDAPVLDGYRAAGVTRAVFRLPPEGRDRILPLLDQYAKLI